MGISGKVPCRGTWCSRERQQRGESCHPFPPGFSSSVILESDPQQVIQKVNFRVSVFLQAPALAPLPPSPSHPPRLLSSRHMELLGLRWWGPRLL